MIDNADLAFLLKLAGRLRHALHDEYSCDLHQDEIKQLESIADAHGFLPLVDPASVKDGAWQEWRPSIASPKEN